MILCTNELPTEDESFGLAFYYAKTIQVETMLSRAMHEETLCNTCDIPLFLK